MRPLSFILPTSLFLLASGTLAQGLPYPHDTAPISTVQVSAPVRGTWVRPDQVGQIAGSYDMSNGWYLQVRTAPRYIDASIDRQPPIRLVQVSPYKFVSGDGNVTMRFNEGNWGDEMVMSYVPDPRVAQVVTLSSRMAQR